MPEREYSAGSQYRYGFNGKERDNEASGQGNQYDYGFRIYNPRLGRFLSVDPLTKNYPMLTPYQFSSNRCIDGIDLDGLEYLRADEARVEFKFGVLQLKIENFNIVTKNKWLAQPNAPNSIGPDPTLSKVDFKVLSTPESPKMEDSPELPNSMDPQMHDSKGPQPGSVALGQTRIGKGLIALQAITAVLDKIASGMVNDDIDKVKNHAALALKAAGDVNYALTAWEYNTGENVLIPEKYRNKNDLVDIMNVVLTGKNNTSNEDIYKIGMDIYNKISMPKPELMKSTMDNYPSKVIIPAGASNTDNDEAP